MEHHSQSGREVAWAGHLSWWPALWRVFGLTGGAVVLPAASTQNLQQLRSGEGLPWRCRPAVETHNENLLKTKTKICISSILPDVQHICHSTAAADGIRRGLGTCEGALCCWFWGSSYTGGRWRWPKQRNIVQQSHTFGLATLKTDPLVEAEKTGRGQHVLWSTWSHVCNFISTWEHATRLKADR